jgi:hypothetical protein
MPRRVLTRDEVAQPRGIPRLRGDSLTRDLVVAWTPASDYNLVTGKSMSRTLVTNQVSAPGLTGRSTGLGTEHIDTGVSIPTEISLTVLVVAARMSDTSTTGNTLTVQTVVHSVSNGGALHRWMLDFGNGFGPSVDKNKPRWGQNNGGFSATNLQLRIDGRLQSSVNPADESLENGRFYTVLASGDLMQGDAPIFLFGQMFGGSFTGDVRIALALVWRRNLSDAEKRSVSANPWQVFEPARRPRSRVRPILSNVDATDIGATTARLQLFVTF